MRTPDWPERLHDAIADARHKPFTWGVWDCTIFAAACVEAMTGEDQMAEYRGGYDDAASGAAALKLHGGGSLYNALRKKFGQPIARGYAQRGDLAIAKTDLGPTVFVVMGETMVGPGDEGIEAHPLDNARHVFHVK